MTQFAVFRQQLTSLNAVLTTLARRGEFVGAPSPEGTPWLTLLRDKMLPQLALPDTLIVAVVGGTNTGKSVVFNHLAEKDASAVSPMAAGTKHPVCLVPPKFADDTPLLATLFDQFDVQPWTEESQPLTACDDHLLFLQPSNSIPDNLLLLDAPDVDSDVQVNWERARIVRETADVLIAVLTQQKYNDAAVKKFFREAAAADKPIVILFNQCDLELDAEYVPHWLATFLENTDSHPEHIYILPHDRRAAEDRQLPFYEYPLPENGVPQQGSLRDELSSLRFDEIKIRTFRGSLRRLLDDATGLPHYLTQLRDKSTEFANAAEELSSQKLARVNWPGLPNALLVQEMLDWWDASRPPWRQKVHGAYRKLGEAVLWPLRKTYALIAEKKPSLEEAFRRDERAAVISAIENLFDGLDRLAKLGNATLQPRLAKITGGETRETLLKKTHKACDEMPPVTEAFREYLTTELNAWQKENPKQVKLLHTLDKTMALARPAVTVGLAVSTFGAAGAIGAVGHTAGGELIVEMAAAGAMTGGAEAAINETGKGLRGALGKLFNKLQMTFVEQRAEWLATWLSENLLGGLLEELRDGATINESHEMQQMTAILRDIRRELAK